MFSSLESRLGQPLERDGEEWDAAASPRRAEAPTSIPTSLTDDDLADVRNRFGHRLPGSHWCGFAVWEGVHQSRRPRPEDCRDGGKPAHPRRLILFTAVDSRRHLTLSRFADGHFELRSETGRRIATADHIGDLIAIVEHPGRR
jgi:hypothetical protein